MTLTQRTDYGLRALMYLTTLKVGERATAADIAATFEISQNHFVKVVNDLARHGYVKTTRGAGGGIELARSASKIKLGEFIEAFQGKLTLHDCVSTEGFCVIESFCKLRGILSQADTVQQTFLNKFTLADLIPTRSKLAALKPSA